ncbi:Cof-type HAD-IIB family hydrolase [Streptococcus sp. X16XC17]|uniref:Cof-type HAD-IIB family hydrolase n=1 Tax=unclassified Streptococcus TaxID=2608887 RepID=UPI00066FB717|nr:MULTISPECIES: Cof-type HAD-IIB family hydrolase [unclassified Streptococcus]TCD46566.1 Cof-type HAD-IIB family hydrolase [Streptococcus sp. X16XC17]
MSIKLIALDLDGTLLNEEKKISAGNKAALKKAHDMGVKIVITTGRPLAAIENILEELELDNEKEYSLAFNGGLVQNNAGQVLDQIGFTLEDIRDIRQVTKELGLPLDAIHGGNAYLLPSAHESLYPTLGLLTYIPTPDEDLPQDTIFNKAVSACDAEYLDSQIPNIPAAFYDRFEIFKSRSMLLEWSPKGVHKASGLAKLIEHLGLTRAEVMACGDEENDLTMIQWAGIGVAMGNASEHIKSVADVVALMTNDEDAVAWAIEQYVVSEDTNGII